MTECWYCETDNHTCSACGDKIGHATFCDDCLAIIHPPEEG